MTYISGQAYSGDRGNRTDRGGRSEDPSGYGIRELHSPTEKQKLSGGYLYFWADHFISASRRQGMHDVNRAYWQKLGAGDPLRRMRLNHNYGISPESTVNHVPIIEPYWRRLKGTHKSTPIRFQTTASNTKAFLSKKKEKAAEVTANLAMMEARVFAMSAQGLDTATMEKAIDGEYQALARRMESKWRSSLEIESQHALSYLVERCNAADVFDDLFDDYGTARLCAWQTLVPQEGVVPTFRALDPRGLYFSKDSGTKWIRNCDAYVYRERMLISDVITRYGSYLKPEHIRMIEAEKIHCHHFGGSHFTDEEIQRYYGTASPDQHGLRDEYVEVWYAEWKANNARGGDKAPAAARRVEGPDKEYSTGYRQDLYCCTRIGGSIYLESGKVRHVVRHQDNPDWCDLTADGMAYDSRFGRTDSLWQRCLHLNDDYDVYKYHLSSYMARSGQKVSPVILEHIPLSYGKNDNERILEHYRREKEGIHVLSVSMAGFNAQMQQSLGGVRDTTISGDVRVVLEILNYTEELVSRMMGVPRQALGDIGQTDGKGTTQMALMQYLMVSQDIFMDMHRVKQVALTSLLNAFRAAFPKGFRGSYADHGRQMQFETGKNFSLASYSVFLSNTGEEQALLELFRQIASDMAAQGNLAKEDLITIMSVKSLAEIQAELYVRLEAQKNDLATQLQQQLAQAEQQLKELKREVDVNQQAENGVNAKRLELEGRKIDNALESKRQQLESYENVEREKLVLEKRRINLEGAELMVGQGPGREVSNG